LGQGNIFCGPHGTNYSQLAKRIRIALLTLIIPTLLHNPTSAQTLEDLRVTAEQRIDIPNPSRLAPSWWSYLTLGQADLEDRIASTVGSLNAAAATLGSSSAEREAQLRQIQLNLDAYLSSSEQTPTVVVPTLQHKEENTLEELLDIDRQVRATVTLLDNQTEQLEQSLASIRAATRELDTRFATYQKLEIGEKKLAQGLALLLTAQPSK
jgi:hypothetical protein